MAKKTGSIDLSTPYKRIVHYQVEPEGTGEYELVQVVEVNVVNKRWKARSSLVPKAEFAKITKQTIEKYALATACYGDPLPPADAKALWPDLS